MEYIMRFFKKKGYDKYFGVNPENNDIKETNDKLSKIFPNSKIVFKLEISHDFKLSGKYIGLYIDDVLFSVQLIDSFHWNMAWIDIISKLHTMKYYLDNPDLYVGKLVLPTKNIK